VENEYRIECEECESTTIVLVNNGENPEYCSICGCRANIEDITENDI
jgi:hypothetical protein